MCSECTDYICDTNTTLCSPQYSTNPPPRTSIFPNKPKKVILYVMSNGIGVAPNGCSVSYVWQTSTGNHARKIRSISGSLCSKKRNVFFQIRTCFTSYKIGFKGQSFSLQVRNHQVPIGRFLLYSAHCFTPQKACSIMVIAVCVVRTAVYLF